MSFDAKWWMSVKDEERSGFVEGYLSCYLREQRGKKGFDQPTGKYVQGVTAAFESAKNRNRSAGKVLVKQGRRRITQGLPKQDTFDGMMWLNYSPAERRGFVEGFVGCFGTSTKAFPRNADYYVEQVSIWYGIQEVEANKQDSLEEDKAKTPIRIVLKKMVRPPGAPL
jgi:hypothetical protein